MSKAVADESKFVAPQEWLPMRYPRRGGLTAHVRPVDRPGQSWLELMKDERGWSQWELEDAPEVDEFIASARRYVAGDRTPRGGAALFHLLTRWAWGAKTNAETIVDEWVIAGGLTFAVEVVLEASDLRATEVQVPIDLIAASTSRAQVIWTVVRSGLGEPTDDDRRIPTHTTRHALARDVRLEQLNFQGAWQEVLTRLRGLLAVASSEHYAAAVEAASGIRTNATRRAVATFLFPTETQWAAPVFDDEELLTWRWSEALLVSVSRLEHANHVLSAGHLSRDWFCDPPRVAAVYDGLGNDIVPLLETEFEAPNIYREDERNARRQKIVELLVQIPSDSAFTALVKCAENRGFRPVLAEAMARYPHRAFRLLFDLNPAMFDRHVLTHPEISREVYDALSLAARHRIDALEQNVPLAQGLPRVLVDPPWTNKKARPAQPVVNGLKPPTISRVDWLPGELEKLQNSPHEHSYTTWDEYKRWIPRTEPESVTDYGAMAIFLLAPDDIARPLLEQWNGENLKSPIRVLARFGLDAVPLLLRLAQARPGAVAPYLLPVINLEVARLHASAFATRKNLRTSALDWLVRHADDAVVLLVPDALGSSSPTRDHAVVALLGLSRRHSIDEIVRMAESYGSEATDALRKILSQDPLDILPKRIPRTPAWVEANTLPPVLTRDRTARLPAPAVEHVLTMCAISKVDNPYPGLAIAAEFCDRGSLAALAWEVFDRWWGADAPSKDNWAILALGWLGDDATVTDLAPLIRRWPGENGTARAQLGLDALAAIGTSRALTELNDIARRMKFKSLKTGAARRVDELADSLGLSHDQLGDRIVPDLGLTGSGTITLSYGTRKFTVGFDESLIPYVIDPAGKRTKSLPKPSDGDDHALAEESKARFIALKREAKGVAAEQIKRLNRAMVIGRRWTRTEFEELLLGHPLLIHVCRRLLWASFTEAGQPVTVFRIAEDNTYADADDNEVSVDSDTIGLVHPAHIPDTIGAWSSVFADYEILQPFAQLGREVHVPQAQDINGSGLTRFTGVTATPSQALRLTYRGWEPVWENPASWGQGLLCTLSDSVSVLLGLDPGLGVGSPYDGYPDQKLVSVELRGGTLADIDAATVSELLADLSGFAR